MKTPFQFIILPIALLSLTTGCSLPEPKKIEVPDIVLSPEVNDFVTCDKKDSELPLHALESKDTFVIHDTIESQDTVQVDCDGKRNRVGIHPVRLLQKDLTLEAPEGLNEKVHFVHVENLRTCSLHKLTAQDEQLLDDLVIPVPDQDPIIIPRQAESAAAHSGKLILRLSDNIFKWGYDINVHDQNNVLKIRYFGECLKYQEASQDKNTSVAKCLEAELLLEKQILVSVQTKRPVIEGTKIENICTKK